MSRRAAEAAATPGKRSRRRGKRAEIARTSQQGMEVLRKAKPKLAKQVLTEVIEALKNDDRAALTALQAAGYAQLELVRRMCVKEIRKRGVVVQSAIGVDGEGNAIYAMKENPALAHLAKFSDLMGITARDMLISKKAKGEAAKEDELAEFIRIRNERARSADPARIPPPMRRQRLIDITPETKTDPA